MKQRVNLPMEKLRQVCAHALDTDAGWQLRDEYNEIMNDLEKFETRLFTGWSRSISTDVK